MKPKTIKIIIGKKFDQWINTITDDNVKNLVKENTILTGGSIASMLLNEDVNDYDFYFRNKETTKAVAEYYVTKFKENPPTTFKNCITEVPITVEEDVNGRIRVRVKSAGVANEQGADNYQYFEGTDDGGETAQNYVDQIAVSLMNGDTEETKKSLEEITSIMEVMRGGTKRFDYRPVFLTTNAITLSNHVQVVVRFYGDPDQIHENYDFVHCTNYWSSWDRELHLNQGALECLLSKELKYIGSKYPLASIFRTRKFIRRGWHITAGQMLKIMFQIKNLDLNDVGVLEDQLIGVDIAYFHELISKLKSKCVDKVDETYLISLIDEIF
jgi:hypothetical protein